MPFAALELKEQESPHQAIECLMRAAVEKGRPFTTLEVVGSLFIGRIRFVRFRTDCSAIGEILSTLDDRARISPEGGAYVCRFPGGATGPVPATSMNVVGRPGERRVYRGPRVKFWERQFI
jgi:hypothetical protein